MIKWLAIAVVAALAASSGATAQTYNDLLPSEVARVATTRALDLRLTEELGVQRPAPLIAGMLFHQNVAPNAIVGVGLANVYGKRKGSSEWRAGQSSPRSRKPALTFVFKF